MGELLHSWFIWFCLIMFVAAMVLDYFVNKQQRKYQRKH